MMWNTKYGMMTGGIWADIFGTPTTTMTVKATEATTIAQLYLNSYIPGTTTGDSPRSMDTTQLKSSIAQHHTECLASTATQDKSGSIPGTGLLCKTN